LTRPGGRNKSLPVDAEEVSEEGGDRAIGIGGLAHGSVQGAGCPGIKGEEEPLLGLSGGGGGGRFAIGDGGSELSKELRDGCEDGGLSWEGRKEGLVRGELKSWLILTDTKVNGGVACACVRGLTVLNILAIDSDSMRSRWCRTSD